MGDGPRRASSSLLPANGAPGRDLWRLSRLNDYPPPKDLTVVGGRGMRSAAGLLLRQSELATSSENRTTGGKRTFGHAGI